MAIEGIVVATQELERRTGGKITASEVVRLYAISRRLHRLDEAACNYGLNARQEAAVERLEAEAEEIAKQYGATAYHQGDPRGWSLYVVWPEDLGGYELAAAYNCGVGIPV